MCAFPRGNKSITSEDVWIRDFKRKVESRNAAAQNQFWFNLSSQVKPPKGIRGSIDRKGGKEKAPHFTEAVDKRLLHPEGRALLRVLSCPPLLTREKTILEGSKKNATRNSINKKPLTGE